MMPRMDEPMPSPALENFKRTINEIVERYDKLSTDALLEEIYRLCIDGDCARDLTIQSALTSLAEQGSIEACAALIALGATEEQLLPGFRALVARSKDLHDGIIVESLTDLLEEWCEEEVAAGRMIKSVDPETGRPLYNFRDKAGPP